MEIVRAFAGRFGRRTVAVARSLAASAAADVDEPVVRPQSCMSGSTDASSASIGTLVVGPAYCDTWADARCTGKTRPRGPNASGATYGTSTELLAPTVASNGT